MWLFLLHSGKGNFHTLPSTICADFFIGLRKYFAAEKSIFLFSKWIFSIYAKTVLRLSPQTSSLPFLFCFPTPTLAVYDWLTILSGMFLHSSSIMNTLNLVPKSLALSPHLAQWNIYFIFNYSISYWSASLLS